ncbi:MAG: prolipoprotein diacylglyceryl transferase [Candidatus Cloacimonadota bacterium]|nr:MAG: prolipoprotein diacylglyceryl transferase [Candidatus Cloacimonadota bacterium]
MFRTLFHIGSFEIHTYGMMQAIAFFTAIFIATRRAKKEGVDPNIIFDFAIWFLVSLVIGARLWYVIEHIREYSANPFDIFKIWEGGLVFYGGFVGGLFGGLLFLRIRKLSFTKIGDILAPSLAISVSIGRIGCFLNGCCYGRISERYGISFPSRGFPPAYADQLKQNLIKPGAAESLPVIPTQLFAVLDNLIIFTILIFLSRRKPFQGFLIWLFFGLYGLHRFIIDFFRYYEDVAKVLGILTLSQVTSLVIIILSVSALAILYRSKGKKKKQAK